MEVRRGPLLIQLWDGRSESRRNFWREPLQFRSRLLLLYFSRGKNPRPSENFYLQVIFVSLSIFNYIYVISEYNKFYTQ